jgi:hypothetical protein
MKTIEISLPDDVLDSLNTISTKSEYFIIEAIKEKLDRINPDKIRIQMIEGYKNTQIEDLEITKEFEILQRNEK